MKEHSSFNWRKEGLTRISHPDGMKSGVYIWVMNWLDIPPHVGISINGSYFSSTVRGPQIDLQVESVWRLCEQKNKPVFFIKIAEEAVNQDLKVADFFTKEVLGTSTCLRPIQELVGLAEKSIPTLTVLIGQLESLQLIEGFYKPAFCHMDWVGIRAYSLADIINHIEALKNYELAT